MSSFFIKFIIWGILTAVTYHICGGIRHMLMDFGFIDKSLSVGRISAIVVFIITAILSILSGVVIC